MKTIPGDIFCSASPSWIGKAIRGVCSAWDPDGRADYNHAGIVIGDDGSTFESRSKIGVFSLRDYKGERILIGRPVGLHPETAMEAIEDLMREHKGQRYPYWRLGLHLVPFLARWISTGKYPVCSELTAKYLWMEHGFHSWKGITPGYLADAIRRWDAFDVVHESSCFDYSEVQ